MPMPSHAGGHASLTVMLLTAPMLWANHETFIENGPGYTGACTLLKGCTPPRLCSCSFPLEAACPHLP